MMTNSSDYFYNNDDINTLENEFSSLLTHNNNSNNYNTGNLVYINPKREFINRSGMIAKSYYKKLINERDYLNTINISYKVPATVRILQAEIDYLQSLFDTNYLNCSYTLPPPQGMVEINLRKVLIPVDKYPDYNFIGRILGPRGLTAKKLEAKTGCKIMIRGRGSMRDKSKEETFIGKPNYQHLNEPLHVLLQAEDTLNRTKVKLDYAENEIKKMLFPTSGNNDDLKKSQLFQLALINGACRNNNGHSTTKGTLSPNKKTTHKTDTNFFDSFNSVNNFFNSDNFNSNLENSPAETLHSSFNYYS